MKFILKKEMLLGLEGTLFKIIYYGEECFCFDISGTGLEFSNCCYVVKKVFNVEDGTLFERAGYNYLRYIGEEEKSPIVTVGMKITFNHEKHTIAIEGKGVSIRFNVREFAPKWKCRKSADFIANLIGLKKAHNTMDSNSCSATRNRRYSFG